VPEALVLKVVVEIEDDHMTVDWSGTSDQVPGAINCPIPFTKSAAFLVVKCLTEAEIPNFQGFIRPIELVAPEGTLVNPRLPGACGARAIIGWRMLDALFGAFAQVVPERIPAAGEGGVSFPAIGGWHEGRPFVCTETLAGAWGALPHLGRRRRPWRGAGARPRTGAGRRRRGIDQPRLRPPGLRRRHRAPGPEPGR
jgi:N-methylhydantoinase B